LVDQVRALALGRNFSIGDVDAILLKRFNKQIEAVFQPQDVVFD
jgi:hypothetical protein